MCGRYQIAADGLPEEMRAILDSLSRRGLPVKTGEIFPADLAPVIAQSQARRPRAFTMRWGYAMEGGKRVINARSETAAHKAMFADGMRQRRCLIPASSYYEWMRRSREKTKYEIADEHAPMLYMAGLYRLTDGGPEFTILTRQPADSIAFIHDRMPVLLPRERLADWLTPDKDAQEILAGALTRVRHSPAPGQAETISLFDEE